MGSISPHARSAIRSPTPLLPAATTANALAAARAFPEDSSYSPMTRQSSTSWLNSQLLIARKILSRFHLVLSGNHDDSFALTRSLTLVDRSPSTISRNSFSRCGIHQPLSILLTVF